MQSGQNSQNLLIRLGTLLQPYIKLELLIVPSTFVQKIRKQGAFVKDIVNGIQLEIPPCHNKALLHRVRACEKLMSKPVKNVRAKVFFTGSLVHFSRACSYIRFSWARIEVNRKTNRPIRPVPPFHSIFQPKRAPTIPNQIQITMVKDEIVLNHFCCNATQNHHGGQWLLLQ